VTGFPKTSGGAPRPRPGLMTPCILMRGRIVILSEGIRTPRWQKSEGVAPLFCIAASSLRRHARWARPYFQHFLARLPDEAGLIGAVSLSKPRRIEHLVVAAITLPLKSGFEKRVSLTRDRGFQSFPRGRDFFDCQDEHRWVRHPRASVSWSSGCGSRSRRQDREALWADRRLTLDRRCFFRQSDHDRMAPAVRLQGFCGSVAR
jgi:hypothetical protein